MKKYDHRETTYSYLTMTACYVCRKKVDLDNRTESGHVLLDDGAHVMVARHEKCKIDRQSNKRGCYGRWEPWMGGAVVVARA